MRLFVILHIKIEKKKHPDSRIIFPTRQTLVCMSVVALKILHPKLHDYGTYYCT